MIEKLRFIFGEIQKVNSEPKGQPGVSECAIAEAFEKIGLIPPAYLVELYEWHNGIWNLNAFLSMNSLDEASEIYSALNERGEMWEDFGWKPSWFPLLNMNGDVHYCIDLETGSLSAIDPEGGTVDTLVSDIENLVNGLFEVFATKSFRFEPVAGTVNIERSVWRRIAQKHGI